MTRSMKALFFIFLGHTLLIVYAAFALSAAAWGFISGRAVLHPVRRLFPRGVAAQPPAAPGSAAAPPRNMPDEEWFDIVDPEGNVRGQAPRSLCHSRKGLLHPVVHLHVLNSQDRLFLQKRSPDKQIQPGKWDTAVGGHVAQRRDGRGGPETGGRGGAGPGAISRPCPWRATSGRATSSPSWSTCSSPAATAVARINAEEISEGKFWKIAKIREALGKGILTPNFEFEFDILLKQVFKEEKDPA